MRLEKDGNKQKVTVDPEEQVIVNRGHGIFPLSCASHYRDSRKEYVIV